MKKRKERLGFTYCSQTRKAALFRATVMVVMLV
jgi:hypothetical protein